MVRRRPVFSAVLGTVAGILILASGCVDQDPTAVQLKPAKALSAARAYERGAYAASIGPSGGSINFPIGEIVFPAGAVSEETVITAKLDGRTLSVDFEPHIVFPSGAQPTLTLSFAGVRVDPGSLVFAHVSDDGTLVGTLRPAVENSLASVAVESFSRWLIISD
jgi:hypothetical protein